MLREADPVAIISMSCRYPKGGNSTQEFWNNLKNGIDCVGDISKTRWPNEDLFDTDPEAPGKIYRAAQRALLDNVDEFDASFMAFPGLKQSRWTPAPPVSGSGLGKRSKMRVSQPVLSTAAIWGFCRDHESRLCPVCRKKPEHIHALISVGNAASTASGGLSYFFGAKGPACR